MAKEKAKAKSTKKGGKTKVRVSFAGVDKEIRGKSERSSRVPEGDYGLKIVSGEVRKSEDKGTTYVSWRFQIDSPKKFKGKTLFGMTSLKPDALWNLRNLIHAATGKNVAGKAMDLDLEKLYGKIIGATVEDDEYNDKVRSRPSVFFPISELEESDDDDEEDDDEDEDEETEDEDEEEDDDDDEDLEEVEVEEL